MVGGKNAGWVFLNDDVPIVEEKSRSIELSKDERIIELERLVNEMKEKSKMVSLLILIIFTTSNLANQIILLFL